MMTFLPKPKALLVALGFFFSALFYLLVFVQPPPGTL